ncbi:lantibiotic dehydratase [Actinomadura sp. DC4]|uniref:lantibiotic dehydratase n=1 Tax=Actinomadura sp. DC4 TaxID=3055069 RepID=UPI0025B1E92D|nr:lantibiotic dehydratase [Actinomadura sp. DC4]MDN3358500.1 lantibiotic dehydratase [Actinomadura sp. DC4]
MTGPQWSFSRRVVVRMAGFPVSWLLRLQSPTATGWVRDFLALEADLLSRRSEYLDWLFEERRTAADALVRSGANRAARRVWRLQPVPPDKLPGTWPERLEPWNAVARERRRLLAAASAGWPAELERLEAVLRCTASSPDLQEAVFLNSPDALTGIRRFAGGQRSAPLRRLVIRYLQRFCVKVETGGFYGPINHGQLVPGSPDPVSLEAGGDGRAGRRRTLLSYWTAQQIASAWARDERLTGLLRLYRAARSDEGSGPAPEPALLALATGEHTLESVARRLGMALDALHAVVLDAQSRGWLRTGIRVPATAGDPLAALRGLVEDSELAARVGLPGQLSMVGHLLGDFEQADLPERERLLAEGSKLLTDLTGVPPARGAGSFYADRFWYTEEAVGNLGHVTFGRPVTGELAGALAPALEILASSAVDEREAQHESVRGLLASAGGVIGAEQLLDMPGPGPGDGTATWPGVRLTGAPRLELTPDDLRDLGLIRGDLDQWPLFCAPDVMLVARDSEQLRGADWQVVLSEAHHICPPTQLPFVTFDPEPARVREETWDAVRSLAGTARPLLQGIDRQNKVRDYTPAGHPVLWLNWQAHEPRADSVRIGDCRVDEGPDGRPVLRDGDGRRLALFPEYEDAYPDMRMLRAVALPGVDKQPVRLSTMTPRITIGRLVYQRQRWDLAADDLPRWQVPAGSFEEYLAAWRWKTEWKMPDQMFARLPGEEKPMFLDFRSPLSVDTFLRAAAGCDRLGLDEMLPGFDDLWLEIAGERYCCELRLTAFRDGGGQPR